MPSNFYYRLSVPNNPLKESAVRLDNAKSVANVIFPQSRDILNQQTIDLFANVGLDVDCCICFLREPLPSKPERKDNMIVHTDWKFVGDQLEPWYFAVNYELLNGSSHMSWWNADGVPLKYPVKQQNNINLCSVISGDIHNPLDDRYKLLERVQISNVPTLVNTSIPHSTDHYGYANRRLSLSIRFKNKVNSWEEGVDLFKDLINYDEIK